MMNTYEILESFLYYTMLYLGILVFGFMTAPDIFPPFFKVISIAFAIPLILVSMMATLIPVIGYFEKNGLRIIDEPLDDMSFIIVIVLAPFVSMLIFGMVYTVASIFIPFLPYPQAFQ